MSGLGKKKLDKKTPAVDELSKNAGKPSKGGFTKSGRNLQKHASGTGKRRDSVWKQSDINVNNPKQANARAKDLVDDILTDPNSKITRNLNGGIDVISPDGRTIRFNRDNSFQGFREPRQ